MIKKVIFHLIFIFLLVIIQLALVNNLPWPLNNFNLFLSLLIMIAIIFSYRLALIWLLFGGFLLDSFSLLPFGSHLLTLFVTMVLVELLFRRYFTNKSIYTILFMGLIGSLLAKTMLLFFSWLAFYLKLSDLAIVVSSLTIIGTIWEIILNLIFLSVLFILLLFLSHKLKTQFLWALNQSH